MEDKKEGMGGCGSCGTSGCGGCGMSKGCGSGMSKSCGSMGGKMYCGWGGMRGFFLLRIILLLAILGVVFGAGFKLGELKERFDGFYGMSDRSFGFSGRHMMTPYGGFYEPGVMQWGNADKQSTTTAR